MLCWGCCGGHAVLGVLFPPFCAGCGLGVRCVCRVHAVAIISVVPARMLMLAKHARPLCVLRVECVVCVKSQQSAVRLLLFFLRASTRPPTHAPLSPRPRRRPLRSTCCPWWRAARWWASSPGMTCSGESGQLATQCGGWVKRAQGPVMPPSSSASSSVGPHCPPQPCAAVGVPAGASMRPSRPSCEGLRGSVAVRAACGGGTVGGTPARPAGGTKQTRFRAKDLILVPQLP